MSKPILKLTKPEEKLLADALALLETIQISNRVQGGSREAEGLRISALDAGVLIKRLQKLAALPA